MTDPYVEDLEFCNKANIAAARRFKAERDELAKTLEVQRPSVMEVENYRLALAWISEQSMDLKSRELANTALIHTGEGIGPTPNLKAENARLRRALEGIAEFCSADATTLGAIKRLTAIRNTADQALRPVGLPKAHADG